MTPAQPRGSFWPTPRQLLILRAISADDAEAGEAWEQLRPRLELERLELGSFELMPLLFRRLEDIAPADPLLAKLAGIYRKTWYTNQLELSRVVPALAALVEAGAAPLVVNGWELVVAYYRDRGVRAVRGLEVLVSPSRADAAEHVLRSAGWQGASPGGTRLPRRAQSTRLMRDGAVCVLHRELFDDFAQAAAATVCAGEGAVAVRLDGVEVRMLAPADEFLSICLSGARARSWPDVRWLADALQISRTASLDWQRVVSQARLLGASLRLESALLYLRDSLSHGVPPEVLSEIARGEANRRERMAHALDSWRGGATGLAPQSLSRYLRATAGESPFHAAARLPAFLRDEWGLRHRRSVPVAVAAKAGARLFATAASLVRRRATAGR